MVKVDGTVEQMFSYETSFDVGGDEFFDTWGTKRLIEQEELLKVENGYLQMDGSLHLQCHVT